MTLVAVNGSPSDTSKTHAVAAAAITLHGGGTLIDLTDLDGDALLLRGEHDSVKAALAAIAVADVVVLVTPVYRATFSGLLKLLLDQLPHGALEGTAVVLAATGASSAHYLSLDTGLRAVVASLGGWAVPTVVYATGDDFNEGNEPAPELLDRLQQALDEAARIASTTTAPS